MTRTLLILGLLSASSCKKNPPNDTVTTQSGASVGSVTPATTSPAEADMEPEPNAGANLPSDARMIGKREKKADISSLGGNVTVQLFEHINPDTGDAERKLDLKLVVMGSGSAIVDLEEEWDPVPEGEAANTLRVVAPLSPPRPFDVADAPKLLPYKGPLLYLKQWKTGHMAIARDGDEIVVWRLGVATEEEEYIGDWYERVRLTLAPGAKLATK